MNGPMDGVRVVELGMWVAGPGAGTVLADWGADVVKVEPPAGDPMRHFYRAVVGIDLPECPPFDMDNRGKRSVVLDVRDSADVARLHALLDDGDVFVSNLRHKALASYGLDPDSVLANHPRLVYALSTGYGRRGPDADRAAYDGGAFWARSGLARSIPAEGEPPPALRAGVGDHITAMNLVAGIGAALFARERTGRGQLVETSLLRSGVYCMSSDLVQQLRWGQVGATVPRGAAPNALMNSYRSGDGSWFVLLGLEADRHWPNLLAAADRPDVLGDDRFASAGSRYACPEDVVAALDTVFESRTMAEWTARFAAHDVWWCPMSTIAEVTTDEQVLASGAIIEVPASTHAGAHRSVASPVDFGGVVTAPRIGAPALGEHNDEVLDALAAR